MYLTCRAANGFLLYVLAAAAPCWTGCRFAPPQKTFADKFADIENDETRDDISELLGAADKVTQADFPDQPFMGPQEAMQGTLDPGQPYEQWEYVRGGEVHLIFFAGDGEPENQWVVVGKTSYPQGAVF